MSRRHSISAIVLMMALPFVATNLLGQTIELQGGTSSLIGASGGSVGVTAGKYQGWLGVGEIQGHFRMGAYGETSLTPNIALAAGDDAASLTLPTDLFTGGQFILTRGAGAILKLNEGKDKVYLFGGTTSFGYGTGFFRAAQSDQAIGLLYFDHEVTTKLHLFSRNAFSGKQTAISGLEWKPYEKTRLALAGGIGGGSPYVASSFSQTSSKFDLKAAFSQSGDGFRRMAQSSPTISEVDGANASVTYRPWNFFGLTTSHNRYITFDSTQGRSLTASTNQGSATLAVAQFGMGGSVYQTSISGHTAQAYSLFASRLIQRWLTTSVTAFRSERWGGGSDTMVVMNLREKIHPRLAISQFITRADGSTTATFGGEFYTNPLRVSVDYQNLYVPFDLNHPFRQALSLSVTTKIVRGSELTVSTFADPTGKLRYTFSMNRYLYRGASAKSMDVAEHWEMGKYLVRGRVVDEEGTPVRGATIYVGNHIVYTDVDGRFFVRFDKPKPEPLHAEPDEFTAPGFWRVLSAPSTVQPQLEGQGAEIEIRVKQLVGDQALERLEQERQKSETGHARTGQATQLP